MDCVVPSWIHGTVSSDIADALDRGCTACAAWLAVQDQFLGNKEHRALYLDAAFRDFSQGDLSINDYCSQFKKKAEKLRDLGEHITDRTLVLNILRGLNEQYSVVASHLRRGRPFPTYADAKAELLMEELSLKHRSTAPATALVAAAGASASAPPAAPSASGGKQQQQRRGKRGGQKNKIGGSGGSNTSSTAGQKASGASPGAPRGWPSFYNPWTGMIQMWPGPRPPLAPIPTAPQQPQHQQQHALVAQQHQQAPPVPFQQPAGAGQWASPAPNYYNPLVGSPTWDQRSLASAFSTMTVTPPSGGDWYFDSGASSHMVSDAGILSHSTPRSSSPSSIIVGNGSLVPVISTGSTTLPGSFQLHNILVSPGLIKNLISVRQFTTDNNCSVEFDPFGCSVKDLPSRSEIIRCNSSGPLYPLRFPPATSFIAGTPQSLWHRRLGHPGHEALAKLVPHLPSCT